MLAIRVDWLLRRPSVENNFKMFTVWSKSSQLHRWGDHDNKNVAVMRSSKALLKNNRLDNDQRDLVISSALTFELSP